MIATLDMAVVWAYISFFALVALVAVALIVCCTISDVAGTRSRERIRRWEIDHEVWMQGQKKEEVEDER